MSLPVDTNLIYRYGASTFAGLFPSSDSTSAQRHKRPTNFLLETSAVFSTCRLAEKDCSICIIVDFSISASICILLLLTWEKVLKKPFGHHLSATRETYLHVFHLDVFEITSTFFPTVPSPSLALFLMGRNTPSHSQVTSSAVAFLRASH